MRTPHLRTRPAREQDVYRVTDARRSHSEDQHGRVVRYLVSMTLRLVCIALAIVTPAPWYWLWVAGAVVLPYVAVLAANAGVEQRPGPLPPVTPRGPTALPGHGSRTGSPAADEEPLEGVVTDPASPDRTTPPGDVPR